MEEELFVPIDQGLTDEHAVIVYLLGYDGEEELLADILSSSPECIEDLEADLRRLGAAAQYYRHKCSLVLREYYDGSSNTMPSLGHFTEGNKCQTRVFPLTTDSTQQSDNSPKHAGLQQDMSISSENTSECCLNSTKSTNQTMKPLTGSEMN